MRSRLWCSLRFAGLSYIYIYIYIYMDSGSGNGNYDEVDGEKSHIVCFQVVNGLSMCRGPILVVLLAGFINLA